MTPPNAPTAAERAGEEPRPAPGSPAAFRYALDNELTTLRRQYGLRSDIKSHWICLLIDEVEALRAALLAARRENETDARTLREMADEMPQYADYEALHQIANRLSPSTATSRDDATGIYSAALAAAHGEDR